MQQRPQVSDTIYVYMHKRLSNESSVPLCKGSDHKKFAGFSKRKYESWPEPDARIRKEENMAQGKHLVGPVSERDHSQGPATAAATLVQYGDYECPYTRQSTTIVRTIQQQLGDQLRFVFRNFPLTEIHPHALHAALAAEAAAAQGKFWQMHDYIFHHQHTLEDADLEQFAEAVGLDMQQFARDMAERPSISRIEEDLQSGIRSGVRGTPTFFINGVLYPGSWEQEALLAALEEAGAS